MKITQLLTKETIVMDVAAQTKNDVIDRLVTQLDTANKLADREAFLQAIHAREAQSTTGVGDGIAIPHAKSAAVKEAAIAFGRSVEGIDYESLDGQPAHLFFMIAAPDGANNTHLAALAKLSSILMNPEARKLLEQAKTAEEVLETIDHFDESDEQDEKEQGSQSTEGSNYVVAVTACPTGIAHTYMAADSLKRKAEEMGVAIKVETNGSGGAKDVLTDEEIAKATAVIVAADTNVEMDRFDGKHVIQVPVAQGIHQAEDLIHRALKRDATIYKANGERKSKSEKEKKSYFYKPLMSGVSNMLPFVVGGGILIAISFMFGIEAANPDDPSYHPLAEALNVIGGGNAFGLMIPVLAGFIAMSIADRPGFAPGMVAGLMASTGGAGFLGGLIAGFLAGYIVVGLKKAFTFLPSSLEGIKPVLIYPLFGILFTGLIMQFVIMEPVTSLNKMMINFLGNLGTGNLVILGLVLGAMMAIDMGGPINKAAFTFGIAMIDAGNYAPHAAIMAGGMVPPLGIAIATTMFKHKFTKQERDAGKTNYIMGASFITEGAIPFAAADPLRVLPSAIVGSAVAGALSMLFKIGLPAPHGGIFVIAIVEGSWFMYLLAILIGSFVTAIMLGLLKKRIPNE